VVKERFKIRVVKHLINAMASKSMQQQSEVDAYEPDKRFTRTTAAAPQSPVGAIQWNYDRTAIIADGVIHALGITLGLGAASTLIILTSHSTSIHPAIIAVYALCLLTMLMFSAAYNLWPVSPRASGCLGDLTNPPFIS
jgi:predicted membrane channel-forming protein YqfA (hemolysin III family)